MQFGHPGCTQLIGFDGGPNARHEQRFRSINIAYTHHHIACQQNLLDGCCALFQALLKQLEFKALCEGLHAQLAQQLGGRFIGFGIGPNSSAKATWVVQAQNTLGGDQIHVIVLARFGLRWRKIQAARHAQMQHQNTAVHVQQKVLAAAPDSHHALPHQKGGRNTQGPPQRLAHVHGQNSSARNSAGETQSGNFDFWQFRHGWASMTGKNGSTP